MPRERTLAIDPGTKCGWAYTDKSQVEPEQAGWWNLKPNRHEGAGMRFVRLRNYLEIIAPTLVVYEEVRGHKGTAAAQIYGGLVSTIQVFCEQREIPYKGIPVFEIKRHATGRANASKDEMHAAAVAKLGMPRNETDDVADALWILHTWLAMVPKGH